MADIDNSVIDGKLTLLEAKAAELDQRAAWQEKIHRNILPSGNVTHYYNLWPTILISALTGAVIVLAAAFLIDPSFFKKVQA